MTRRFSEVSEKDKAKKNMMLCLFTVWQFYASVKLKLWYMYDDEK